MNIHLHSSISTKVISVLNILFLKYQSVDLKVKANFNMINYISSKYFSERFLLARGVLLIFCEYALQRTLGCSVPYICRGKLFQRMHKVTFPAV